MLFDCSGTSVIFFCVWSFNLTCVSNNNNKLKMLPEDEGELAPIHTLWWVCLVYHYRHTWNISYLPPKMTRGTGNGSMYSLSCNRKPHQGYLHSSTHPQCHLKFHLHFQTRWIHSTSSKMFLSDPLSSDPPICAWVSQLVSSLFVFWSKCYMRVLSLMWATGLVYSILHFFIFCKLFGKK